MGRFFIARLSKELFIVLLIVAIFDQSKTISYFQRLAYIIIPF